MSDQSQGPGWWQASDGKWYPPDQHPDATSVAPSPGADDTGPVDPGSPPSAGEDYPMTPPATPPTEAASTPPGAPPAAPPGSPPYLSDQAGEDGGDGGGKAGLVVGLILGGLFLLVLLAILAITFLGGDDGDEETKTTDQPKGDADAAALEAASTDYLTAVLEGDGSGAYAFLSSDCQDEVDEDDFTTQVEDLVESLDDYDLDPSDATLDEVDVEVDGDEGSVEVTFDGSDDFVSFGYSLIPRTWTAEGSDWAVPDCDGRLGAWYTPDEAGFSTANTEFANATFQADLPATWAFQSEECRDEIDGDEDTYLDGMEESLDLAEGILGVDLSDLTATGFTDVEVDGDEGEGIIELDIPDDFLDDAEDDVSISDFEDAEPSNSVYEGGIWRTTDCGEFSDEPIDFEPIEPSFDDSEPSIDEPSDALPSDIVPLGQVGVVGDWEVRVISFEENADATVAAEPGSLDPLEGHQYSLVNVEVRYVGEGSSTPFDLDWTAVTDLGEFTEFGSACGAVPGELDTAQTLNSGDVATGNLCLEMEIGAAPSTQLLVEDFFADAAGPLLFAVR